MTLTPGTRVVVTAPCPGWLPWTMVGDVAEVVRASPLSVMLRLLDPQQGDHALRYVPAPAAEECLELWDGKETP